MFVVQRLLKSSVKSYLSKFIQNEITLNQMEYTQDGVFELKDFHLNVVELNNQLLDSVPFIKNLGFENAKIDNMTIHPSWNNVINKIDINGVEIVLNNNPLQKMSVPNLDDNSKSNNSIFYYDGNESTMDESTINEQDLAGYKVVLDKVENIANDFQLFVKNINIQFGDLKILFGFEYTRKRIVINDICIVMNDATIFESPQVVLEDKDNLIEVFCKEGYVTGTTQNFKSLILLIKNIFKDNDEFSEMYHSPKPKKSMSFMCENLSLNLNGKNITITNLGVNSSENYIEISSGKIDSEIVNFDGFDFKFSKNNSPHESNSNFKTPFSEKACYYNGTQKPESITNAKGRELFKQEKKEKSKYHFSIKSNIIRVDIKPFYKLVKDIIEVISVKPADVEENDVFDDEEFLNNSFDNNNNESLSSSSALDNSSKIVWWLEIDANFISAKLDDFIQFKGRDVSFFFSEYYWCLDSPKIIWSPQNIKTCKVKNVHLAGNIPLNHFVAEIDNCEVMDFDNCIDVVKNMMDQEAEALEVKMYIKLKHLSAPNLYDINDKNLNLQIDILEIFTTGKCINFTIEKILGNLDNQPMLEVDLFHINIFDKHFGNRPSDFKWNINNLKCIVDSNDFKSILNKVKDIIPTKPIDRKEKDQLRLEFIDNYDGNSNEDHHDVQRLIQEGTMTKWCIMLKQSYNVNDNIQLRGEGFNILTFQDKNNRTILKFPTFEIIDGVESSLWYKAFWTKNIEVLLIDNYLSVEANSDLMLNIDHDFILFISKFFEWDIQQSFIDMDQQPLQANSEKPPFSSIHISELTFRLDYKPKDKEELFEFTNFMALRNSKILFREFYMFNIRSINELVQSIALNLFTNMDNIQGVIAGMKPVKPIAKILGGAKNVIILPINTKLDKNFGSKVKTQLKKVLKDTAIEVLEVGCGLNISLDNKKSIYSNQPATIKQGFESAEKQFSDGMKTVFAFVKNGEDADLLSLPIAVVRPFTGGLSQILLGICNQLDPSRKKRMDNKYK